MTDPHERPRLPSATAAIAYGLRAVRQRWALIIGIFVVNLAWAFACTVPFYLRLARATALRPFAAPLARGLQLDVLQEVAARSPGVVTDALAALLLGAAGWAVLGWFLTAGVLGVLQLPASSLRLRRFAALAAARGFAMARIQGWSALLYAVTLGVLAGGGYLGGWLGSRAVNPWVMVVAAGAGALPGALLTLVATTAVDAARVVAATGETRAMWRVLCGALRLVGARPRRLLGVQVWGGLLMLLASAIYLALAWPTAYAGGAALVLLMLMREVAILARLGLRVATLAATLHLVDAAAARVGIADEAGRSRGLAPEAGDRLPQPGRHAEGLAFQCRGEGVEPPG